MTSVDPEIKAEVRDILTEHRGKDNAITSTDLLEMVDMEDAEGNPRIREVITELIFEDEVPIASYNKGYFLIEAEEELDEYLEHLEKRIMGHTERKLVIRRAAEEWDGPIEESEDLDLL